MLSRRDWEPEEVVRLLLWVFVSFALGGLFQSWLKTAAFPSAAATTAWIPMVAGQFVFHATALVATARFLRRQNRGWSDGFGIRRAESARAAGVGLLAGLAFLPAAYGLQGVVGVLLEALGVELPAQRAVELLLNTSGTGRAAFFVAAVVVAPVVEEIIFRGVLYPFFRDLGRPRAALIGTAVAFGLIHGNASVMVPLTAFGVLLALLYEHTGSLLTPVVAHVTFNLAPFVMLALGIDFSAGRSAGQ